jgi:NAD+ synthase (glutamine-hydrolysing)
VALPKLALTGYPPEDLLLKPSFVEDQLAALARRRRNTEQCVAIVGFVDRVPSSTRPPSPLPCGDRSVTPGTCLTPSPSACGGEILGCTASGTCRTARCSTSSATSPRAPRPLALYEIAGVPVGVTICEGAWWPMAPCAPGTAAAALVVNAQRFALPGKVLEHEQMLRRAGAETGCMIAYVNLVGGQDELVFDGASLVVDARGDVVVRGRSSRRRWWSPTSMGAPSALPARPCPSPRSAGASARRRRRVRPARRPPRPGARGLQALCAGHAIRHQNGFSDVVIGQSGGDDS